MSTFDGEIEEIDYISVDRFLPNRYHCHAFFLSHFHVDHMVGILDFLRIKRHYKEEVYLYSSEVTMKLLQNNFPQHLDQFKSLPIGKVCAINIPTKNIILSVSLLPAGHCPGSVMFLFEGKKNILYTGDFRINARDLRRYRALYYPNGQLKKIYKIYLDTTFFFERYKKFPSREDSLKALCEKIKVLDNQCVHINLETSAKYGGEFLVVELYNRLHKPIHVAFNYYDINQYFPCMDNALTLDAYKTNIHYFCKGWKKYCKPKPSVKVKHIKTSARSWTGWDKGKPLIIEENNHIKVCFSCHSSYDEIIEFLDFFKPLEISINVEPHDFNDKIELERNINDCLQRYRMDSSLENSESNERKSIT